MKLHSFLVLIFGGFALCQVLTNVRLINHIDYTIDVITRTVNIVEERGWSNMRLPDYVHELNETVLGNTVSGKVNYNNGFVTSIQHVDIIQSTVQQVWFFNTTIGVTTVSIRGTLRMHNVAVGYDVISDLDDQTDVQRYTTKYVHPLISFAFSIIKDVNMDTLEVTVVGTVPRTTLIPRFRPINATSDILASTFDPTAITSDGIIAWGPEIFQPITYELVTNEVPFPNMCYNCAA